MLKALVTGASSGIGRDMAIYLSKKGYDIILVARNKKELEKVAHDIATKTKIISLDLSDTNNCLKLYDMVKNDEIEVLINNAGFGVFGPFENTNIDKELNMIDVNIKAIHLLTKLFYKEMKKRNHGYILNVSSSASFQPGPLMATYYATKAYVLRLTTALYEELRRDCSKVVVSVLCPGPVDTNFNKVAGVGSQLKSLPSNYVAKYAVDNLFKRKLIIIPGRYMKILYFFSRITPTKLILKISYSIQKRKGHNK